MYALLLLLLLWIMLLLLLLISPSGAQLTGLARSCLRSVHLRVSSGHAAVRPGRPSHANTCSAPVAPGARGYRLSLAVQSLAASL